LDNSKSNQSAPGHEDRACLEKNLSLDWDELSDVEMKDTVSLTLNETGYVVGQSRATINRAVDQGVIKAKLFRGPRPQAEHHRDCR
jgi:hypothetical protein